MKPWSDLTPFERDVLVANAFEAMPTHDPGEEFASSAREWWEWQFDRWVPIEMDHAEYLHLDGNTALEALRTIRQPNEQAAFMQKWLNQHLPVGDWTNAWQALVAGPDHIFASLYDAGLLDWPRGQTPDADGRTRGG